MSDESLWIFGYGSLVWRPAFPHGRRAPAWISGYTRRFWQGSTDHRGVPTQPGRVVTLIPAQHPSLASADDDSRSPLARPTSPALSATEARCWGTAYEVRVEDRDDVLAGLDHRERGGYERLVLEMKVHLEPGPPESIPGLVYIAGPHNDNYLGPAPVSEIARQIHSAVGPSGANPEYVFELARSLREMGAEDEHVFAVEAALSNRLRRRAGD